MEAALHAGTEWIEAPEQSGGGEGAPIHEMDQDELNEVAELTGRLFDKFLRWLGIKDKPPAASEVRTSAESKPAETLEPSKPEPVKEPVEQPREPEQAELRQVSAWEPAARLRATVVPVRAKAANPGRMAVFYASMPKGSGYPGLDDSVRVRVDALPPHERESLSRTGRHYPGMQALEEIEARVRRSAVYDHAQANDMGARSEMTLKLR